MIRFLRRFPPGLLPKLVTFLGGNRLLKGIIFIPELRVPLFVLSGICVGSSLHRRVGSGTGRSY